MTTSQSHQAIYPTIRYTDARAAIAFLVDALGFRQISMMDNPDGTIAHAEVAYGDSIVMISSRRPEPGPFETGKACLYVAVDNPDEHHATASAAAAKVVMELTDQDYGSREYAVEDPDGNVWVFGTYRPELPAEA
jgi:uncharacterized glyoxalase superfamily protein PhnB